MTGGGCGQRSSKHSWHPSAGFLLANRPFESKNEKRRQAPNPGNVAGVPHAPPSLRRRGARLQTPSLSLSVVPMMTTCGRIRGRRDDAVLHSDGARLLLCATPTRMTTPICGSHATISPDPSSLPGALFETGSHDKTKHTRNNLPDRERGTLKPGSWLRTHVFLASPHTNQIGGGRPRR